MEHVPSDETERQAPQIFNQLHGLYDQFSQCRINAHKASQRLLTQKNFTPTQCKRATASLSELDHPIEDLYALLKQEFLPANVTLQSHSIGLILHEIAKAREGVYSSIGVFVLANRNWRGTEARNTRENIIRSIQSLEKQLDQLSDLLATITSSTAPATSVTKPIPPEAAVPQPLPSTNRVWLFIAWLYSFLQLLSQILRHRPVKKLLPSDPEVNQADQESTKVLLHTNVVAKQITMSMSPKELFNFLSALLTNHIDDLDLRQICRKFDIDYNSLEDRNPATRAFSLTTKMENANRLDELERELRDRLPKRFPDWEHYHSSKE